MQIMKGRVCPYCKKASTLVDSKVIYGISYGMIYACKPCDAYVGCHAGTKRAKGRLANKALRQLKKEAHLYFDKIWKLKLLSRNDAYQWLSEMIKLPRKYTHIGMLGEKTCREVIYYSKQFLNDNRRFDLDFGVEPVTPYYELNP